MVATGRRPRRGEPPRLRVRGGGSALPVPSATQVDSAPPHRRQPRGRALPAWRGQAGSGPTAGVGLRRPASPVRDASVLFLHVDSAPPVPGPRLVVRPRVRPALARSPVAWSLLRPQREPCGSSWRPPLTLGGPYRSPSVTVGGFLGQPGLHLCQDRFGLL